MIEMNDVGKRLGAHWVLSHINLQVRQGESIALFGRNGSGKSTLLKILATLLAPSAGSVKILGLDPSEDRAAVRRRIRLLAHEKQLYGSLTVLENLRLAAALRGVPGGETKRQAAELLERIELAKVRDRRVSQLSEGMKKRVVLARLLVGNEAPDLILLDEPHPTLDESGRRILDGLIREWRGKGKTVVLASHDHDRALLHADRLLVLEEGRISYDGPPKNPEEAAG
jgi:heme ABC exporter ATP-binding subunit CcmA